MFTVALVGRPNVGKSTLFNRFAKKKLAIVNDMPGVTRDWREATGYVFDRQIRVIDTAGLEKAKAGTLTDRMRLGTEAILKTADLILFVIDGIEGVTPVDRHFAGIARKSGRPVQVLVNKCEGKRGREGVSDAYSLGFGEPTGISAEHGDGMADLFRLIMDKMPPEEEEADETDEQPLTGDAFSDATLDAIEGNIEYEFEDKLPEEKYLKVAIAGRPNAGKSTLVNALLGQDRVLTGPEAGITRDSIAIDWEFRGRRMRLIDTAGMRKRAKVVEHLEQASTFESMRAIRLAQVVILVVDGTLGLDRQDLNIAQHVLEEGRILVIAVNKWDAVENREETKGHIQDRLLTSLGQLPDAPIVYLSALQGQKLNQLLDMVLKTYEIWHSRVSTGKLNRWLQAAESRHPAPMVNGRPNRLRYGTQVKTRPPTFAIWVSKPDDVPDDYQRYLVNGLRRDFGIIGVPVRLMFRSSKNPYAD